MTRVANPDRMRLTILYLRLWKLCDTEFDGIREFDSAKHYDVVAIDTAGIRKELERVSASNLDWSKDPKEIRDEIRHTLQLIDATRKDRSKRNLAALDTLRKTFQKKAFDFAGDIQLASEASN